jgi:NO-binding membrane sensor protein with MHYT domain
MALWAAKTGRRQLHRQWVVGSYLGLLGAGIAAMAFPVRLAPQLLVHRPLVFAAAVLAVAGVTAAVVRLAKRPARRAVRRQEVAAAR